MEQKPAPQNSARELTSWKEIAQYLDVNIRTAQKWERERGLPVRRASGERSRVSADLTSLNAWKQKLVYVTNYADRCYRWPLGQNISVEVRFLGADLGAAHIDLLLEYLGLFKTALR